MAARSVSFGGSKLLHKSLEHLNLKDTQIAHLQRALLAVEDETFYTEESRCELHDVEPDGPRITLQLRICNLARMVSDSTLQCVIDALKPRIVSWNLQFDSTHMHLEMVLVFMDTASPSGNDDVRLMQSRRAKRQRTSRHVRPASDVIQLPLVKKGALGRIADAVLDRAAEASSDTAWLSVSFPTVGMIERDVLVKLLGTEDDADFFIQFSQTLVGNELQPPRLYVGIKTDEKDRHFVARVYNFKRWTSHQYAFLMEHYQSKIAQMRYSYDYEYGQYNGVIAFLLKLHSPLD